jgi:hypothetical protein
VASRRPSLIPFANLMYGPHFTVRVLPDNESGTVHVASARELRQGNPLGSLLFASVLQHPLQLQGVAAAHPAVHPIAYTDDKG